MSLLQRMAAASKQGVAGVREALQACSSEAASLAAAVQQDREELVQAMQQGAAADGSTADSLTASCFAGMAALDGRGHCDNRTYCNMQNPNCQITATAAKTGAGRIQ